MMMNIKFIVVVLLVLYVIYLIYAKVFMDNSFTTIADAKIEQTISAEDMDSESSDANFTYSVWFNVNDWGYKYGDPKIVLGRVGKSITEQPQFGIVLGAMQNELIINIDTYADSNKSKSTNHVCNIQNVPLQKWVHCLVSVYNKTMDVYIDGKLVRTSILPGVAKIDNNTDLLVTPSGGFAGYTSRVSYYSNATNPEEAYNIYSNGYGSSYFAGSIPTYSLKVSVLNDNKNLASIQI